MIHPSTSVDAFGVAQSTGKLLEERVLVATAFKVYGPGTSAEVLAAAGLDDNLNLRRARVTELEDMGLLQVVERRTCSRTGAMVKVLTWSPTGAPREKTFAIELTDADVQVFEHTSDALPVGFREKVVEQARVTRKRLAGTQKQRSVILARVEAP